MGRSPGFQEREGGSVPVVGQFQSLLGVESVNVGFSLPGDNMHSPNEKLHLPTWYKGIDCLVHFFYNLGESRLNHGDKSRLYLRDTESTEF